MSKKEEVQEQQDANAIVITIQLAEAIVGYLKTKPMVEVEAFVNAMSQSPGVYFESDAEPKK
jgi:hypothetical protein